MCKLFLPCITLHIASDATNSSLVMYLKLTQRNGFWFLHPWVLPSCLVICMIYEIAVKRLNGQTQVRVWESCLCLNPPSYIFRLHFFQSSRTREGDVQSLHPSAEIQECLMIEVLDSRNNENILHKKEHFPIWEKIYFSCHAKPLYTMMIKIKMLHWLKAVKYLKMRCFSY